jgi:hypothetical protein
MNTEMIFLPGFDESHVRNYFSNNSGAIKEMFTLVNDTLENDLREVLDAVQKNNIVQVQEEVHTIRPLFHLLGLLEIDQELNHFYILCMSSTAVSEIENDFKQIWPKLEGARFLINEQTILFGLETSSV